MTFLLTCLDNLNTISLTNVQAWHVKNPENGSNLISESQEIF